MKLLSLFSGIGAFEKAFTRLGINYELINYCEIDKYASKAYSVIHDCDEDKNLGDITKIDTSLLPKNIDLITYGFPCQDISIAGKQTGFVNEDGSNTRSGLFFEALRIIKDTQPRVAIAENVKNLVGKKFQKEFEIVLKSLEEIGYNNYWKVLNAKDYGIPQNRERVFVVSIRKDIDDGTFEFPIKQNLNLRLRDMLESNVDEKYYIDDEKTERFFKNNPQLDLSKNCLGTCHERNDMSFTIRDRVYNVEKDSPTLSATMYKDAPKILVDTDRCIQVGTLDRPDYHDFSKILKDQSCIGTLTTNCGSSAFRTGVKLIELKKVGNIYPSKGQNGNIYDANGISPTINAGIGVNGSGIGSNNAPKITCTFANETNNQKLRIRKLTPKECFRLMGFEDSDFDKLVEAKISNTQLYKMAGNSIVTNIVEQLFKNLENILTGEKDMLTKVEEKKVVRFNTDKMIDLVTLIEKEPELFDDLAKDYPCEDATYIYEVKAEA